jgi:hypothetical protein
MQVSGDSACIVIAHRAVEPLLAWQSQSDSAPSPPVPADTPSSAHSGHNCVE